MYTNRILFCTGPDVKFEFLHPTTTEVSSMVAPPLSFKGITWIPHFNGQKVGISNKRVIGLPKNPPRFWPDQKKSDPMTRLVSNFFAASRGDPIKSYRCTALEGRQSGIFGSALHFWRAFCSVRLCPLLIQAIQVCACWRPHVSDRYTQFNWNLILCNRTFIQNLV